LEECSCEPSVDDDYDDGEESFEGPQPSPPPSSFTKDSPSPII